MSLVRYNHLTETLEADLMLAEKYLGWHFCPMNEGKLINKSDEAFRNFECKCKDFVLEEEDECCL